MSQEYAGKEKSLKSKFELVNADKIKQENALWNYNTNFILLPKKLNKPLSIEALLKDTVVETAFSNI